MNESPDSGHGFATDAVHAGQEPDAATGAVTVPIYQTSTYAQPELGRDRGYTYARGGNPTRRALERNLAALEGGRHASAFASGMAAVSAVLTLLRSGDHVLASSHLYGGTHRLFRRIFEPFGISFTYVDPTRIDRFEAALTPSTRMLYLETPSNPMMRLTDLAAAADLARRHRLISVCDNTFMSPFLQRPLAHGIDIVVHSTTKFINGHSDSVGGAVITGHSEYAERIAFTQAAAGAILSPFDSFLVLRGVKTLPLRMQRHDASARELARFLAAHARVREVFYPGLTEHPQHALACKQMDGFGGMIAFELGDFGAARTFLNALRLITLAESLGGVESLVGHPATMTHASLDGAQREAIGVTDGLVRLSVGVEDLEDLRGDLHRALAALG